MKVCLCCIGKMENLYIREFVEHYKNLGFDKIFLYDNNDKNGEYFDLVIGDYSYSGFVEIIDYRGKKMCQLEAYQDCYDNKCKDYDWIFICDCDEFLTLTKADNIKEFLSNERFAEYGCIFVNWRIMNDGDKNLLFYDGKKLSERFDHFNEDDGVNMHTKSILRCNLNDIIFNNGTHSPRKKCKVCNVLGDDIPEINNILCGPIYENAYLKHYIVKTPSEYSLIKRLRGNADLTDSESIKRLNKDFYFAFSKKTKDKEKIIDNFIC